MTAFADSSALVKLYVPEPGYASVQAVGAAMAVSQLSRVEVPAAFWRKHRLGELAAGDAGLLTAAFEHDFYGDAAVPPRFGVVAASDHVLALAARLAASHGLRAYDAVQLSSAIAARGADPACVLFICFDDVLRAAAAIEGFTLVPP